MSKRVRVKPGKAQALIGFFMGLILCVMGGFFIVTPSSGPFAYAWTLFAIIITIMNGINAFSEKGIALHEITIDDSNENNMEYRKTSEERLNELQSLYAKGIVAEEEYQKKRKQILEDI